MENFVFENSTKAYFGKKCVSQYLPDLLSQYGSRVVLAYGGGSIKRTGIYDEIMDILKKAGKDVIEFSGIMANPTYDKVLEGAAQVRQHQADLILAVGGGSVMDCCKAVALAAVYDGDIWQDFWAKRGRIDVTPVPLGIVMTTSRLRSLLNTGMGACVLAIILYLANIQLPYVLAQSISMVGSMTAPLAMMLLGSFLMDTDWKGLIDGKMIAFTFIKMLVIPIGITLLLGQFVHNTYLLAACMAALATPSGNVIPLLAAIYNKEAYTVSVQGIAVTTAVTVVTMPLVALATGLG